MTVVQAKAASWGQGEKLRLLLVPGEAAEEAGQPASSSAESRATKTESGARTRIGTDNSDTRRGLPGLRCTRRPPSSPTSALWGPTCRVPRAAAEPPTRSAMLLALTVPEIVTPGT